MKKNRWRLVSGSVALLLVSNCTSDPAFWNGVAAGLAGAGTPYSSQTSIFPTSPQLLLFGGSNHSVFLGCINCSKYDSGSVFNPYGTYGSPYGSESVFNKYGDYGSRYSNYSPCNPYASEPPAVVDRGGNFYGYLTLNHYNSPVRNDAIIAWITGVCGA